MSEQPAPPNGIASSPPSSSSSSSPSPYSQFADIPLELLQAELRRRHGGGSSSSSEGMAKPECGTKGVQAEYSVSSHVFALFLILILSTVACAFPILARRFPKLPIPHRFLFLSRHFGTGVLIATAFVHLLPTAFNSLSDPCLPDFWTRDYTPMPGLIAMVAVLAVVGIEMFFASQGAGHVHGSDFDQAPPMTTTGARAGAAAAVDGEGAGVDHDGYEFGTVTSREPKLGRASRPRAYSEHSLQEGGRYGGDADDDVGMNELDKLHGTEQEEWGGMRTSGTGINGRASMQNGRAKGPGQDSDEEDDGDLALDLDELDPHTTTTREGDEEDDDDDADLLPGSSNSNSAAARRKAAHRRNQSMVSTGSLAHASPALAQRLLLQCVLLEAGILFHSVFIGMAVSVTRGSAFAVLLVAIAFHQTFEGFALGARISAIVPLLPPGSPRPWLMALAYGTTTPLGQAVGLAIHGLYDPKSETGLILVGTMNAISSGLLLFAGLVELLAEDFLSESSYRSLKGRRRTEACVAVVAGAFLMAAVGAFA